MKAINKHNRFVNNCIGKNTNNYNFSTQRNFQLRWYSDDFFFVNEEERTLKVRKTSYILKWKDETIIEFPALFPPVLGAPDNYLVQLLSILYHKHTFKYQQYLKFKESVFQSYPTFPWMCNLCKDRKHVKNEDLKNGKTHYILPFIYTLSPSQKEELSQVLYTLARG